MFIIINPFYVSVCIYCLICHMNRNICIACLYLMECEVTKQISYNCSSKEPAKLFENYNNYKTRIKINFPFLEWFVRQGVTNTLRKLRRNLQKEKKVWESK